MVLDRPKLHIDSAASHEAAAERHEHSAAFWAHRGDDRRSALQRELAENRRRAAELERRWAYLIAPKVEDFD